MSRLSAPICASVWRSPMSAWRTGGWPSPELNPGARGDECPVQPFDFDIPRASSMARKRPTLAIVGQGPAATVTPRIVYEILTISRIWLGKICCLSPLSDGHYVLRGIEAVNERSAIQTRKNRYVKFTPMAYNLNREANNTDIVLR